MAPAMGARLTWTDRKSTRLNSSHLVISYAVFCLKKKMPGFGIQTGTNNMANDSGEVIAINPNADAGSQSPLNNADSYNFFFFNDTATTEIYTLSLHDALPI